MFYKENDWSVLVFFPKEHMRTLNSKRLKISHIFYTVKGTSPLALSV